MDIGEIGDCHCELNFIYDHLITFITTVTMPSNIFFL